MRRVLDSEVVLKLALGRRVDFAVPPKDAKTIATLQRAAALYVRHLFFRPEATPYQVLGLAPGASPQAIKESFRLLMQLVHPDRQDELAVWPDAFAAQANRAYGILRNQDSRARFDREAEARAAMARAMHRAAAASAASKMPVVLRPRPRFGGGLLRRMALPEWLTAGVGGYAREHPAAIAFTVLIVAAALTVGTMGWEATGRMADPGRARGPGTAPRPRCSPYRARSPAPAVAGSGCVRAGRNCQTAARRPKSPKLADTSASPGARRSRRSRGPVPAGERACPRRPCLRRSALPLARTAPTPREVAVPAPVAVRAGAAHGPAPAPILPPLQPRPRCRSRHRRGRDRCSHRRGRDLQSHGHFRLRAAAAHVGTVPSPGAEPRRAGLLGRRATATARHHGDRDAVRDVRRSVRAGSRRRVRRVVRRRRRCQPPSRPGGHTR